MTTKDFIRVTPKGATKAVILTAANEIYFRSQGATIAPATADDIAKAFPEYAHHFRPATATKAEQTTANKQATEKPKRGRKKK